MNVVRIIGGAEDGWNAIELLGTGTSKAGKSLLDLEALQVPVKLTKGNFRFQARNGIMRRWSWRDSRRTSS